MNKIERALVNRAKKILFEYAKEELEKYKKKLYDTDEILLLNVFDSGITIDLTELKKTGIKHLQKRLENHKIMQ